MTDNNTTSIFALTEEIKLQCDNCTNKECKENDSVACFKAVEDWFLRTIGYKENPSKREDKMVKEYRKKPVQIQAICFTGHNAAECKEFMGIYPEEQDYHYIDSICIETLEGTMTASVGDYIIKGVHGEFYPCKPDIFTETYDEVYDDYWDE